MKLVPPSFKLVYGAFSSSNHSHSFCNSEGANLGCSKVFLSDLNMKTLFLIPMDKGSIVMMVHNTMSG